MFFMGLLITFYIQGDKRIFGATVEEKNKSLVAPGS
jgi:hypothetical protein